MARPEILIVEDEALIGLDLKMSLESMGFGVQGPVATGEEALAALSQRPARLVLMDIVLRGKLDGIETAREVRRRWGLPVVFLTAFADKGMRELAMTAQPAAIISKPVNRERLRQVLAAALPAYAPPAPRTAPARP